MAYLLEELVPERRAEIEARAAEFARQRMICGVHFPSDLAAGKKAADWMLKELRSRREFSTDAAAAAAELRAALELAPLAR
jgi:acid phosphatase (class A)